MFISLFLPLDREFFFIFYKVIAAEAHARLFRNEHFVDFFLFIMKFLSFLIVRFIFEAGFFNLFFIENLS